MFKNKKDVLEKQPFYHIYLENFLDNNQLTEILDYMQSEKIDWQLATKSFYTQYEICWLKNFRKKNHIAVEVDYFLSNLFIDSIIDFIQRHFSCNDLACFDISAHKLISGHHISIHNDSMNDNKPYYRFVVHLNKDWCLTTNGGGLALYERSEGGFIQSHYYSPIFGSIFAFEISDCSYHAVTPIVKSERFTIIYTFVSKE